MTYLRIFPLTPTLSRKDGGGRHDYPSYADRALQEAIVNAVVHRDYEVRGSQIIIRLFPDRIELRNPGALYNTLTVENLYAGCQPVRRNQLLAGFMRNYKSAVTGGSFMEARGEGFLNLVRGSLRLSGRRPELEQIGDAAKLHDLRGEVRGERDRAASPVAAFRQAVSPSRRILVIAGPNGADKTTFVTEFLPNEADCPLFVNANLITAGLNPFRPALAAVQAGRLTLQQIGEHVRRGDSFAFETTLSGRGHARRSPYWRTLGYRVELLFLRLPTPEMAVTRVAHQVSGGGCDVPNTLIIRRFSRGRRNFENVYRDLVDEWRLCDNSGGAPVLLTVRRQAVSTHDQVSPRELGDPDLASADAALHRAAERVRREAAAAGRTVVFRDGEIVWEKPGREYLPQGRNTDGCET